MPNQFQEQVELPNVGPVLLQGFRPDSLYEVSPGRWRFMIGSGRYYSDSDRDAGRIRAEMKLEQPLVLGQWNTLSYTVERPEEEFPIFGSERADKITQGQFFYYGSNSRPPYWLETLGGAHQFFLNSYVDKDIAAAYPIGQLKRLERVCHEVRPYADGTADVRISSDGTLIQQWDRVSFESSFSGDLVFKIGLYMSRGAGRLNDPIPDFVAYYSDIRYHVGQAVLGDLFGSELPHAPTPEPQPEPVDPTDPGLPQQPTPTAPPETWMISGNIGPIPINLRFRKE